MKKKPIYLWVLLIFSALLSAMSLFGIISPVPTADSVNNIEKLGGDATYARSSLITPLRYRSMVILSSAFSWLSYLLF